MEKAISLASASQPMIVKYVETSRNGIQSQTLSRYAIGYVLRGTKYIYDGDQRMRIGKGHLFYLSAGHHYMEDVPADGQPFEQILLYYTPAELQRILMHLSITYGLDISNEHHCAECVSRAYVSTPGWSSIRNFFNNTNLYLRDEHIDHSRPAESIKMTELLYDIIAHDDGCLKSKILCNVDTAKENFEQVVYDHVFLDVSIDELAQKTNRSLTSFKKEFRRLFHMPPHQWFIRQRLMRARLLLISTSLSVSQIGMQCSFPNTSHFIKLFKKEYTLTPANYRTRHAASSSAPSAAPSTPLSASPSSEAENDVRAMAGVGTPENGSLRQMFL